MAAKKDQTTFGFFIKINPNPKTGEPERDKVTGLLRGRIIPQATIEGISVAVECCRWFSSTQGDINKGLEEVMLSSGMLSAPVKKRRLALLAKRKADRAK